MSQKVQSVEPKESRVAFYLLIGLLGIAFLAVLVFTVMMYFD